MTERAALVAEVDALIDNFEAGDIVTIRERPELYEVLEKRDPRGCDETTVMTLCCVPLVLLWPVTPGSEADDHAWLIEPRDLSLVDRPAA